MYDRITAAHPVLCWLIFVAFTFGVGVVTWDVLDPGPQAEISFEMQTKGMDR